MPAIGDRQARRVRAKPSYNERIKRGQVAGPPAPKPRLIPPRAPTYAEQHYARAKQRQVAEPPKPKTRPTPRLSPPRPERTAPGPSSAAIERYKQSEPYIRTVQAARATRAKRLRKSLFHGYARETAAEAQAREDRPHVAPGLQRPLQAKDIAGPPSPKAKPITGKPPKLDEPRTNRELREFLKSGRRPYEVKPGEIARAEQAVRLAPVTKIIEQGQRPIHAVAAAAKHDVQQYKKHGIKGIVGHGSLGAAKKGIQNKDKAYFSDVFTEAGWKPKGALGKAAKAAAGFTGDVVFDVTTYAGGGLGAVAAKGGSKAAIQAAERAAVKSAAGAVEAGAKRTVPEKLAERVERRAAARAHGGGPATSTLTERAETRAARGGAAEQAGKQAKTQAKEAGAKRGHAVRAGERAATETAAATPTTKGLVITLAGKELPLVRRGTAAGTRKVRAGARKVLPRVVQAVPGKTRRGLRKTVRPMTRPVEIPEEQFVGGRQAQRIARAHVAQEDERALLLAQEAAAKLPDEHFDAVINALERDRLGKLPKEVREDDVMRGAVHDIRSAYRGAFQRARRAGGTEGKVGNIREWLSGAQKAKLEGTILSEQAAQKRGLESARKQARHEAGREAVAEEAARGSAQRVAAVATERGRGQARTAAQREQHAADIAYERAHAGARVSAATPTTTPQLKQHLRSLDAATSAHDTARTSLRHASAHLKRVLAKPTAQRRHVASAYGKVTRAQRRVEESKNALAIAREKVKNERKRTAGVAPAQHETLLGAIERKGQKVTPATVERVTPEAPGGARLERAGARRAESNVQVGTARAGHEASIRIPERSLHESHHEYLHRLVKYADQHDLPLVKSRAEKLLVARPTDLARGYYPRDFDDRMLKQLGYKPEEVKEHVFTRTGQGFKIARSTPGMKRAEQRRLSAVNPAREAAEQTPYSTNVPLATLNYLKRLSRSTGTGEYAKRIAGQGRPLKVVRDEHGKIAQPKLREGEALYKLGYGTDKKFGLHPADKIPEKPNGQYHAINKALVDELHGETRQIIPPLPGEEFYDRLSGTWRRVAIGTPSYHLRNLYSDTNTAYLAVPGHKLPGAVVEAGKATARASERKRNWRPTTSDATIKVAGQDEPVDEFLNGAAEHGVLGTGYAGSELEQLGPRSGERAGRISKGGGLVGQRITRWTVNRENVMRLAVYKSARDRGMTKEAAADYANKHLVDYSDLTDFEKRALRRLTGFYTWAARSLPLAAETLVTRPGKYANVEKLRQEIGAATTGGTPDERNTAITESVQRSYPILVGDKALGWGSPTTLLNEFPTGLSGKDLKAWKDEMGRFAWSNLHPLPRAIIESRTGRNVVTKAEIEKPDRPLVAAPAWVQFLPDELAKPLGVKPPKGKGKGGSGFTDPKTGQPTWAWNGKKDWEYDQLMVGAFGQVGSLANSGRSQATKAQAIAAGLGIRIDPIDKNMKTRAAQQAPRDELSKLTRARGILNQQGITKENATPDYKVLSKRINELTKLIQPQKKKAATGDILGGSSGGGGDILGGSGGSATTDILK